jgi:hypothetical protein
MIDVPNLQVECVAHVIGRFIRSIGSKGGQIVFITILATKRKLGEKANANA